MPRLHFASLALLLVVVAGCGKEPVREDRTIEWARDGGDVTFQHGKEGVYVTDKEGTGLTKIFEPDETVLATSRPLYSPSDGRLIFTTAHDPGGQPRPAASGLFPDSPEGRVDLQRPVQYTCWIRDASADGGASAPRKLFSASCEHIGYISAGLAVRWHPDGQRILFVDSVRWVTGNDWTPQTHQQHGVYEFDLRTQKKRRVFPHLANDLIFDFTSKGSRLVCVAGGSKSANGAGETPIGVAGIWIGNPDDDKSWWKVAGSERRAAGELPSVIEDLRATRPAWTGDDARCAFATAEPDRNGSPTAKSHLQMTILDTRENRTIFESDGLLADLHWSSDGRILGFIERRSKGDAVLRSYTDERGVSELVSTRRVRQFAGFDSQGARLAYVVADMASVPDPHEQWALLLLPDRFARDVVVVAETTDLKTTSDVFSGMRVTFPAWSPKDNRLSLWMTFVPRYHSLLSILRRWGLWPGDPAATLDLATGEVSWLAVTPSEELQVGHYYLLKKDYARAWEWYERAYQKFPPRKPPRDLVEFTQTIGAPERSQLFEYHCLRQLGREAEAQERLDKFERNFFPAEATGPDSSDRDDQVAAPEIPALIANDLFVQFGPQGRLLKRLIHDLYIAEVYLSVDAPEAGIAFLSDHRQSDDDDVSRLSRAMALSQFLLVVGRRADYLAICTDSLLPQALAAWEPADKANTAAVPGRDNELLRLFGGLCLAPLFRAEFLAAIADDDVLAAIDRWETQRAGFDTGYPALAIDLFLRAAQLRLNHADEVREIEARLVRNPARQTAFGEKPIDDAVREIFSAVNQWNPTR